MSKRSDWLSGCAAIATAVGQAIFGLAFNGTTARMTAGFFVIAIVGAVLVSAIIVNGIPSEKRRRPKAIGYLFGPILIAISAAIMFLVDERPSMHLLLYTVGMADIGVLLTVLVLFQAATAGRSKLGESDR